MMAAGDLVRQQDGAGAFAPVLRLCAVLTDLLDWSGRILSVLSLAALFAALLVNVVLRYAFGDGIPWAYEIHSVLLPWMVCGGVVIAAAQARHITVTLIFTLVPEKIHRPVTALMHVAVIAICVATLYSSWPILKASQYQTLSTLGVKQVWGYASLAYAFGALTLIALGELVATLSGTKVMTRDVENESLS